MRQLFDIYNNPEKPTVILKTIGEENIDLITHAEDLHPTLVDNGTQTLSFSITDSVENPTITYYDDILLKNRILFEDQDIMFVITGCNETIDGVAKTKSVECVSLDAEDFNKPVTIREGLYAIFDPLKQDESLLHIIIKQIPEWTIGNVDAELQTLKRRFDSYNDNAYAFLMNNMEDMFECIFTFDTINKKVHCETNENHGGDSPVVLRMTSVVKDATKNTDNSKFTTAFEVMGGNGLSISSVNPLGTNIMYDYSGVYDRMNSTFRDKVVSWDNKVKSRQQEFANISTTLNTKFAELQTMQTDLKKIENDKAAKWEALSIAPDSTYHSLWMEYTDLERKELDKKNEIKTKQLEIENVKAQLKVINDDLQPLNNFTTNELVMLSRYTYIAQVIDEDFTQNSNMSNKEIQDTSQRLYDKYKAILHKQSGELISVDVNMDNIIFDKDYEYYTKNLVLGRDVTVELGNDKFATARLLMVDWNYDDISSMSIQIADGLKPMGDKFEVAEKKIHKNIIDNTLKADMSGWKEATSNNTFVNTLQNEGLNANLNAIKSNENNEFRIDGTGAVMRKYNPDLDSYSPEAIWLAYNQIVITDDAFETIKCAIGKLLFPDGTTWGVGVSTEVLVGKIIAGQKCIIQTEDTMVTIDGDGILVENGKIQIKDKNGHSYIDGEKIVLGDFVGMTTNQSLPKGDNVVIWAGSTEVDKDTAIFRVYDDGAIYATKGYFEGTIYAKDGEFNGDVITPDGGICNHGGGDSPLFWGGSSHNNKDTADFKVSHNGKLKAKKAEIDGSISCTELFIDGERLNNIIKPSGKIGAEFIENLDATNINATFMKSISSWSKNIFTEELQTNFDDWLFEGNSQQTVNYIYINKEKQQMLTRNVSLTEYDFLKVNGQQVYTLFADGEYKNKYFTFENMLEKAIMFTPLTSYDVGTLITNGVEYKIVLQSTPNTYKKWEELILPFAEVCDADTYKVKVKKTIGSPIVKWEQKFDSIKLTSGAFTVMPIQSWGTGTGGNRGRFDMYKGQEGQYFKQWNEHNNGFTGMRFNANTQEVEIWDEKTSKWRAIFQTYSNGDNIFQVGNVVIHPAGTTLETAKPSGLPSLHVVHSGTVLKDWGLSKLMQHSTILGEEIVMSTPPIVRLITVNITVTAFDGVSCEGLTVTIDGVNSVSSKTDAQGKCTIAVDDDNYTVSISGYDTSKYTTEPQQIVKGGVTPLKLSFTLADTSVPENYIYKLGVEKIPLVAEYATEFGEVVVGEQEKRSTSLWMILPSANDQISYRYYKTDLVDLSKINKIYCKYRGISANSQYVAALLFVTVDRAGPITGGMVKWHQLEGAPIGESIMELDVSDHADSLYIGFGVLTNGGTGYLVEGEILEVWLE